MSEGAVKPDAVLSQRMLDAQVGVLGSMLIDESTVAPVLQTIRDEDFTDTPYRTIYTAIRHLFAEASPIDAVTVRGKIGPGYDELLVRIMELTPTAANVDAYVDLLRKSSMLCKLRDIGTQLENAGMLEEATALVDKAVALQIHRSSVPYMDLQQGYQQFFDRHDGGTKPDFISWGVPVMDERIFAEAGDMVVLGGYPSDGKTALALQFGAGIGKKHKVGFFSFESKKEKLFDRYVANNAMLSYTRIKRNDLKEADYDELLQLKNKLTAPQMMLIDAARMSVADIQAFSQAHHFEVVIVDYLQKCAAPSGGKRMTDFERVSSISSDLQQFGRLTDTVVIALSQLSRPDRDKRSRKIRPPVLSDLRSSGQIEQDADVVLLLSREDYDQKESVRRLTFAKNKEGEAFDYVRFKFDGDLQTFSRIAPEAPADPKEAPRVKQPNLFDGGFTVLAQTDPENPFLQEGKA